MPQGQVVQQLLSVLSLDDSQYRRGLKRAETAPKNLIRSWDDASRRMRNAGIVASAAAAPIAIAMKAAWGEARTFNQTMANTNSIMQLSKSELAQVNEQVLKIGSGSADGPQKVAEAFYNVVSSVSDSSKHMAILTAAERTATAGRANLLATTKVLTGTMNAYNYEANDAVKVSDVLTASIAKGALTMDELALALPRVTSVAASSNVSLEEVASSLSFITTRGVQTREAATGLKAMITTLLAPTTELQKVINELGYETGEALLSDKGLYGAYELIKSNTGTFSGIIKNVTALGAAAALVNDEFKVHNEQFLGMQEGATERAAVIQTEADSWELLQSQLTALRIEVGNNLDPIIKKLTQETLIPVIERTRDWIKENPRAVETLIKVGGAAVIAGPVLTVLWGVITSLGVAFKILVGLKAGVIAFFNIFKMGGLVSQAAGTLAVMATNLASVIGGLSVLGVPLAGAGVGIAGANDLINLATEFAQRPDAQEMFRGLKEGLISKEEAERHMFHFLSQERGDVAARLGDSFFFDKVYRAHEIPTGNKELPGIDIPYDPKTDPLTEERFPDVGPEIDPIIKGALEGYYDLPVVWSDNPADRPSTPEPIIIDDNGGYNPNADPLISERFNVGAGDTNIYNVNINANSEEEGAEAARGWNREFMYSYQGGR